MDNLELTRKFLLAVPSFNLLNISSRRFMKIIFLLLKDVKATENEF